MTALLNDLNLLLAQYNAYICEIKLINSYRHDNTELLCDLAFTGNGIDNFIDDLRLLAEISAEERLREKNPALKNAYEEYQLILKLIKQ